MYDVITVHTLTGNITAQILPLEVSRRVWELHPKVFESRLDSLLEQYAQDPYRRALVQQLRVEEFASGIPSKQLVGLVRVTTWEGVIQNSSVAHTRAPVLQDIIEYWPKSCRAVIEQSGLTSGLGRGQQRVLTSTSGRRYVIEACCRGSRVGLHLRTCRACIACRRSADSTLQEMASLIGTSWKLYKGSVNALHFACFCRAHHCTFQRSRYSPGADGVHSHWYVG